MLDMILSQVLQVEVALACHAVPIIGSWNSLLPSADWLLGLLNTCSRFAHIQMFQDVETSKTDVTLIEQVGLNQSSIVLALFGARHSFRWLPTRRLCSC